MARKSSKRLVYVLSSSSSDYGHSLGINSLAVDPVGSWLYTAGRDGVVNSWKLDGANLSRSSDFADFNNSPEAPPATNPPRSHGTTKHCAKVPVHTNWVNDVILVNDRQSLVSCSSDLTVKLWNPRDNTQHLIGRHRDYVKCLAAQTPQSTMVVSGGLDRRIMAWDLETASEILSISTVDRETGNEPKSSVYALDITREANIIASGGPESIVRLFDARSADPILKFVGHNDNIRSLLISDDGKWVLSGSSDATIKLWSVAAARLMHTFDMHDDSIWSLYSQHPTLDVFYSADRSGLVTKTDLRAATVKNAWSASSPGRAPAFAQSSSSSLEDVDTYGGVCSVVCNEHQGVSKLVAEGDYLWTATANSCIHRWQNFDTTPYSHKVFLRNKNTTAAATSGLSSLLQSTTLNPADNTNSNNTNSNIEDTNIEEENNIEDDDRSSMDHDIEALQHAHDDMEPLLGAGGDQPHAAPPAASDSQSVVSATSTAPTANTTALESDEDDKDKKEDKDAPPTVSFLHLDGGPSLEFAKPSVRAKPRSAITVAPVHQNPVETLEGHIGLIKHRLLTDRRRVLTLDSAGEVQLWDLLKCVPLRSYGTGHDLDELADQIMAYESADGPTPVVVNWCTVTTRTGELFVTLEEGTCFDAEIYADEHEEIRDRFASSDDHRINLGRWVIKNLLNSAIRAEVERDKANRRDFKKRALQKSPSSNSVATVSSLASVGVRNPSNGSAHEAINSVVTQPVVQAAAPAAPSAPQTAPQKTKFMGRLRGFGKKKERSASTVGPSASSQSVSTVGSSSTSTTTSANLNGSANNNSNNNNNNNNSATTPPKEDRPEMTMEQVVEELEHSAIKQGTPAYIPPGDSEAPPLDIPAHTKIMVSEMSPDSGGTVDLYRGTVGTVGQELPAFEKVAPEWIARLILRDELPAKDPHKIGFILHPHSEAEPSIQSSYTSPANTDIRLSAYQMLRARKVLIYLVERLNQGSETQYAPEQFELYCQDHLVKPELSLATIRTKLWRSGGDLVLKYKFI